MKVLVTNYTFNAIAKTVTFNSYSTLELNRLLLITNATRNTIIYNFASPALGGVVTGNIIRLTADTSTMQNTDKLQIFYENEDSPVSDEAIALLRRITASLRGVQNVDSSDRQRVAIDSIPQTAITYQNMFSGVDQREEVYVAAQTAFGTNKRPLLISS